MPVLQATAGERLRGWLVHRGLRLLMAVYLVLVRMSKRIGPRVRKVDLPGCDILLTGTFYSENWIMSHLRPLAQAKNSARIRVVSVYPIPPFDKVEAIYPPGWLIRWIGKVPARLVTFFWEGLHSRPHIVGGFHLLFNGLSAALLARMTGARSLYFCVGGPAEVLHGGKMSENRLFERLVSPDPVLEKRLLQAVSEFDTVVTMGTRAVTFFRERNVSTSFYVLSGGIDGSRFNGTGHCKDIDLLFVGRLAPIKRVDLFLRVVRQVQEVHPYIKAVVVGDGPLFEELGLQARELGIQNGVSFVGFQRNIEMWMSRSKVFVLTSDSEGLSLAMMEAMFAGLPVVVPDVGDLSDLVVDGVNGYLVRDRNPRAFQSRILELIENPERLDRFSTMARHLVGRYDERHTAQLWDDLFDALMIQQPMQ